MVGDLDAVEILLIQSRKKLRLSLRAVIRGNVWRLDKLSCSCPNLTAAEQKQETENSSTNKTASWWDLLPTWRDFAEMEQKR